MGSTDLAFDNIRMLLNVFKHCTILLCQKVDAWSKILSRLTMDRKLSVLVENCEGPGKLEIQQQFHSLPHCQSQITFFKPFPSPYYSSAFHHHNGRSAHLTKNIIVSGPFSRRKGNLGELTLALLSRCLGPGDNSVRFFLDLWIIATIFAEYKTSDIYIESTVYSWL